MREKKTKISGALKILTCFIAVMLLFSVISSFTAAAVVPRVRVSPPSRQPLNYEITGSAEIKTDGGYVIPLSSDYRVTEVFVHPGEKVSTGEPLFSYSTDDIREKYDEVSSEINQLNGEAEKLRLESTKSATDDSCEAEEKALDDAELALLEEKENLRDVIADYQNELKENLNLLKKKYSESVGNNADLIDAQRNFEDAELAYSLAYDKYTDAQILGTASGSEMSELYYNCASAQDALARAEKDLAKAKKNAESKNTELAEEINTAQKKYNEILLESIDNPTEAGKDSQDIISARRAVRAAEKTFDDCKYALEKKKIKLEQEKSDKLIDEKIESIDNSLANQKLKEKSKELATLQALIEADGMIVSDRDGVISSLDAQSGKIGNENDIVAVSSDDFYLEGTISEKAAKFFKPGDIMYVTYRSGENPIECPVTSIGSVGSDGNVKFTMSFDYEGAMLGACAEYRSSVSLGMFECCIPYQALHYENNEKFVLVIRESKGILGTELVAVKIPVTVTEENGVSASVEGAITSDDRIIVNSSRPIKAGDKVRYYED